MTPLSDSLPSVTVARTPTVLDNAVLRLIRLWTDVRGRGVRGRVARYVLKAVGVDWQPLSVGSGLVMPHATTGSVVHVKTRIGNDVTVFHGATIGRSDPWLAADDSNLDEGVVLEDGAVLGAHAVVLFSRGQRLTVGRGTVVGAGAVLLQSTGDHEIWAGNPARRVGQRRS